MGKPVQLDLLKRIDRQVVIDLVFQKRKNEVGELVETDRLQISYAGIYHVDDPQVADVPKDQDRLAEIPTSWRHDAEWFAFKKKTAKKAAAKADSFSDL